MPTHIKAKRAFAITFFVLAMLSIPNRGIAADFIGIYGGYGGYSGTIEQSEADGWGALVTTDSADTEPEYDQPSSIHPIPGINATATDGAEGTVKDDSTGTIGAGGAGGSVTATFATNVNVTGDVLFTGGTGGDGVAGGPAGAGGFVQIDAQNHAFTVSKEFSLVGGDGGVGGANDGAGGNVALTNLKELRVGTDSNDDLLLVGGTGGSTATTQGGSVTLAVNETLTIVTDMYMVSGESGTDNVGDAGGAGGDVTATSRTVRLGDDLFMKSRGSSKALFSAQSVTFFNGTAATGHTLELDASDGGILSFSAGELLFDEAADPGKNPFKIQLFDTTAATSRADAEANGGIFIDTITLRNNARLDLTDAGAPGTGPGKTYNFNMFRILDNATLKGDSTTLDFSKTTLNFALQKAGGYAAGDVVLHIDSTDAMNVSGGTLALGSFEGLWRLKANDNLVLIDTSTGSLGKILAGGNALATTDEIFQSYDGSGRILSLQVIEDGTANQHRLNVRGASSGEAAKPLALGARAGLSTVTAMQDAGLRAFASPSPIKTGAGEGAKTPGSIQPLAIVGMDIASLRHNGGDRVDTQVATLVAGPGVRFENRLGTTTLGAVFEGAWGNYDASNDMALGNTVHQINGSGDIHSLGGALLLRHDLASGLYGETSVRAGSVNINFSSGYNSLGSFGAYDVNSSYWGGSLGGGQVLSFGKTSLDIYNKLLWTRQNGFAENIAYPTTTRRLEVDAADSLRNRLGIRTTHSLGAHVSAFWGAAWEYEFDGKTSSRLDGDRIAPIASQGHSGLGEIGFSFQLNEATSLSLSGFGVTGKRTGSGGSASLCAVW